MKTTKPLFLDTSTVFLALLFFSFLIPQLATASLQLVTVQVRSTDSTLYILPWDDTKPLATALSRYLSGITQNDDLNKLLNFENDHLSTWRTAQLQPMGLEPPSDLLRALILANQSSDHGPHPALSTQYNRLNNFARPLSQRGVRSYTLPVGAALSLNPHERQEFYKLITENFALMLHLGGDDIDPQVVGESNRHSVVTSPTRDHLEFELATHYVKSQQGFSFGVCRGMQLLLLVQGGKIHQDVLLDGITVSPHRGQTGTSDEVTVKPVYHNVTFNPQSHFASYFNGTWLVNSVHHQAGDLASLVGNTNLLPLAVSSDGVLEAIEFTNGRGLGLQFHPELMPGSEALEQSFDAVVTQALALTPNSKQTNQPSRPLLQDPSSQNCSSLF